MTSNVDESDRKFTFSGKCAPGPGDVSLLFSFVNRSPIENTGGFFKITSYRPSYVPGPGKRTTCGSGCFWRPVIV